MVHAHRQDVRLRAQVEVRRQIVFEAGIPVGPRTKERTVDPDGAVAVHAIEPDRDFPPAQGYRELEGLPVPADSARQEAGAARVFLTVRPFDGPIVRQIDLPPAVIGEGRGLRLRHVPQMKPPAVIEEPAFAWGLRVARHSRQEERHQRRL